MNASLLQVKDALRTEDIEGLIESGAPDDEYDSEAEEITEALNGLHKSEFNDDRITNIISLVWRRMFGLDDADIEKRTPAFGNVANRLQDK